MTVTQQAHKTQGAIGPLSALRREELEAVVDVIQRTYPNKELSFRRVFLKEPAKSAVVDALTGRSKALPRRYGIAFFYFKGEIAFMEAVVDIEAKKLLSKRVLEGKHGAGSDEEMLRVQEAANDSEEVKAEIARLQLPEGCQVIAEPWPYGSDDTPQTERLFEVWYFMNTKENRDHPGANFYAHPLDFAAVVRGRDMKVIRIDRMPMTSDFAPSTDPKARYQQNPNDEYAPEFQKLREDLKPINIIQPEGVSFVVEGDGETVRWQKWRFTVNFDIREGVVLRNVTYDGRTIFYRAALSEMTVPYGDPREPVHRKSAYDLGECGAGQTANNLQLGCDCLGAIHYFNGFGCHPDGSVQEIPNAICMHEQDAGLGWKHTNVRTGRADVTRLRELVLQLILTVGNYEYALYWVFDTAGLLHWEVRATGIMSVTPSDLDVDPSSYNYGTMVSPGVFAPHHQHIFNLRVDPAIGGYEDNAIQVEEVLPMARDGNNPHGVGFYTDTRTVTHESAFNLDWNTHSTVKLVNPKVLHPVSKKPIGYKVMVPPTQLGLAHESSMHNTRGEFVDHHIHVTKHDDSELYAAGDHPWQSTGGDGGCRTWSARGRELAGDGVLWVTIGFTHITRPEDWPVMPVEVFRMHFKPVNFFDRNPALDVPPSRQAINKSVKAECEEKVCCK